MRIGYRSIGHIAVREWKARVVIIGEHDRCTGEYRARRFRYASLNSAQYVVGHRRADEERW